MGLSRVWTWLRALPWLRETWRSGVAVLLVLPVVGIRIGTQPDDSEHAVARGVDSSLLFLAGYLLCYVVVTFAAFSTADDGRVRRWAHREGRGSWLQRYVLGTAPGPGVAITLGLVALIVAVFWLPDQGDGGSRLPDTARLVVGVGIVALSWLAVALSYAVAYWADNLLEDERGLGFPDEDTPGWSDYLYFAVGVSTTFGTTDVDVRSRQMRRTVTVHAVLAFVFNTVILAAAVGALT